VLPSLDQHILSEGFGHGSGLLQLEILRCFKNSGHIQGAMDRC
jgi:hypothetical protein